MFLDINFFKWGFAGLGSEEQLKLQQEYMDYQKKLDQQKADYRKDHPDEVGD